jgi:hypothetical protein
MYTQITHELFLTSYCIFYFFFHIFRCSLSEIHSLNLKLLCSKKYKKIVLHLIVVPQLSSGW